MFIHLFSRFDSPENMATTSKAFDFCRQIYPNAEMTMMRGIIMLYMSVIW